MATIYDILISIDSDILSCGIVNSGSTHIVAAGERQLPWLLENERDFSTMD